MHLRRRSAQDSIAATIKNVFSSSASSGGGTSTGTSTGTSSGTNGASGTSTTSANATEDSDRPPGELTQLSKRRSRTVDDELSTRAARAISAPPDITVTAASGLTGEHLAVYKVHRRILTAHSHHFHRILRGNGGQLDIDVLSLPVCDTFNVFPALLRWMYDGVDTRWPPETRVYVSAIAVALGVPRLLHSLRTQLRTTPTADLVQCLRVATDVVASREISTHIVSALARRLAATAPADRQDFYALTCAQMEMVLRSTALDLVRMEGDLVEWVDGYLTARERRHHDHITLPRVKAFRQLGRSLQRLQTVLRDIASLSQCAAAPLSVTVSPLLLARDAKDEFYDRLRGGDGDLTYFTFVPHVQMLRRHSAASAGNSAAGSGSSSGSPAANSGRCNSPVMQQLAEDGLMSPVSTPPRSGGTPAQPSPRSTSARPRSRLLPSPFFEGSRVDTIAFSNNSSSLSMSGRNDGGGDDYFSIKPSPFFDASGASSAATPSNSATAGSHSAPCSPSDDATAGTGDDKLAISLSAFSMAAADSNGSFTLLNSPVPPRSPRISPADHPHQHHQHPYNARGDISAPLLVTSSPELPRDGDVESAMQRRLRAQFSAGILASHDQNSDNNHSVPTLSSSGSGNSNKPAMRPRENSGGIYMAASPSGTPTDTPLSHHPWSPAKQVRATGRLGSFSEVTGAVSALHLGANENKPSSASSSSSSTATGSSTTGSTPSYKASSSIKTSNSAVDRDEEGTASATSSTLTTPRSTPQQTPILSRPRRLSGKARIIIDLKLPQ